MTPEAKPNSLSGGHQKQRASSEDPMMAHAKIWNHVNSMAPHQLASAADRVNYVTPLLGKLSSNPNVTAKDVIKAAASGVADGKATAQEAIAFISKIPEDPAKVQPWLKNLYAQNMAASVHMKAAQMAQQTAAPPSSAPQATPPMVGQPAPQPMPQPTPAQMPQVSA